MICKWHKCAEGPKGSRAEFPETRMTQEFCGNKCRIARATWKQARGAPMVDLLLDGKWKELRETRARIQKEISDAT